MSRNVLLVVLLAFLPFSISAHKGEKHSKLDKETITSKSTESMKVISQEYVHSVKPIFQRSCFDCHSSATNYPWYSNLPFVKKMIDDDVAEAREHLDMSSDYPFSGHGSPEEDLKALKKVLEKGDMPPTRYRLMHRGAGLTPLEVGIVFRWIEKSLAYLHDGPS